MQGLIPLTTNFIKKNASVILTTLSVVGVAGTSILSARAGASSEKTKSKKEYVKKNWKNYIPAVTTATATIACIAGNGIINKNNQAALISAYALLDNSYHQYKAKVKEICGEETHQKIIDSIMKEQCKEVCFTVPGLIGTSSTNFDVSDDIVRTFYDTYSKRYFESTISRVLQAQYHFNRNYTLSGVASLNDWYDCLGLENVPNGDDIGWSYYSEINFIDFNNHVTTLDDGMEICVIDFDWDPCADYLNEY